MIHDYLGVDLNLVWETVEKDIPALKYKIKKLKKGTQYLKNLSVPLRVHFLGFSYKIVHLREDFTKNI